MNPNEFKEFVTCSEEFLEAFQKKYGYTQQTRDLADAVSRLKKYAKDDFRIKIAITAIQAMVVTTAFTEANKELVRNKGQLQTVVDVLDNAAKVAGAIISVAAALCP